MKKSAAERTIGEEEVLRAEESGVYKRHPAVIAVRSFVYSVILSAFIYELVRVGKGGEVTMRLFSPLIASACLGVVELIERAGRIRMPAYLDIAAHLFICGCLPLGSTYAFYSVVPGWDKLLHTFSGFVFYFSGLCIGGLLAGKAEGRRRVAIVVVTGLAIALSVGYLWELFEYAGDSFFGMDNQRWQGGILGTTEDGYYINSDPRGTALIDTMTDMLVNFIGIMLCFVPTLIAFLHRPSRVDNFTFVKVPKKQ